MPSAAAAAAVTSDLPSPAEPMRRAGTEDLYAKVSTSIAAGPIGTAMPHSVATSAGSKPLGRTRTAFLAARRWPAGPPTALTTVIFGPWTTDPPTPPAATVVRLRAACRICETVVLATVFTEVFTEFLLLLLDMMGRAFVSEGNRRWAGTGGSRVGVVERTEGK